MAFNRQVTAAGTIIVTTTGWRPRSATSADAQATGVEKTPLTKQPTPDQLILAIAGVPWSSDRAGLSAGPAQDCS
jgi:hypothetical protein